MKLAFAVLTVLALTSCGGGGGNPGECFGSAEVCGDGGTGGTSGTPAIGSGAAPGDDDLGKLTCAGFASQPQAQSAFAAGAKQLDPDGDGVACEELL